MPRIVIEPYHNKKKVVWKKYIKIDWIFIKQYDEADRKNVIAFW